MEKLSAGFKAAGPLTPTKLNPSGFRSGCDFSLSLKPGWFILQFQSECLLDF